jgi:AAA family ATP:ADP antiporter
LATGSGHEDVGSNARTLLTHPELRSHHSVPAFKTLGEPAKNTLERLLSFFADVRAGEGVGATLLALNVFLLLGLYYLLKPARAALILTEGGAEVAAYSSAAQAVLLVGFIPLFGWLSSRIPRVKLIATTSLFFATNLVVFYVLGRAGVREGVVFYIWLGIFNNFIVAQFWAFANDLYTEGQGRRLFPFIGVGASLGAWLGASAVPSLLNDAGFTPYTLMFIAAIVLLVALVITIVVNARETARSGPEGAKIEGTPLGREGGFELILRDRYLMWIAVLTILLNVVNTTGEYLLNKLVENAAAAAYSAPGQIAESRAFIGSFMGSFYGNVNLVGLLLQLFVTSRVMRYMGVRGALFILPIIALVNYSIIAVAPILAVVRIGKIFENSTDYSIQNTIRQALYLPTSREAKYKAKAAIDTFCTRLGDVASAGVIAAGSAISVGVTGFGWLNVGLTGVWLVVAGRIAREHRRKTL